MSIVPTSPLGNYCLRLKTSISECASFQAGVSPSTEQEALKHISIGKRPVDPNEWALENVLELPHVVIYFPRATYPAQGGAMGKRHHPAIELVMAFLVATPEEVRHTDDEAYYAAMNVIDGTVQELIDRTDPRTGVDELSMSFIGQVDELVRCNENDPSDYWFVEYSVRS